ncbi:MAG: ArdC family protein [Polymorphobacter sp.]
MRQDIYEEVTASIVAALEAGERPWAPRWSGMNANPMRLPERWNGASYNGINILLLWSAAQRHGYAAPRWLTFKQALNLGGNVRKGEKSSRVVFAGAVEREREGEGGTTTTTRIPFLKTYAVFNAEQCEGLPADFTPAPPVSQIEASARLQECDTFFANTGASVAEKDLGGAFYSPADDAITLPPFVTFRNPAIYYATLAHETVHWTGHKSRLDRRFDGGQRFGGEACAMEELVAELGAAFLCAGFGIVAETRVDHAAYVASWLKALKSDKRAIFTAASAASRAANYLLGLQPGAIATAPADEMADA